MNDLRTSGSNCAETEPALQADLTRVRGVVRRLPEGVAKQQAELLAAQIANGVPEKFITGQLKVMGGGQ